MRTINPEGVLGLKIILNAFMVRSKICRFNFEADLVLCTDFAHCDVNDVTMPHVLGIEKKDTVYYVISFREG